MLWFWVLLVTCLAVKMRQKVDLRRPTAVRKDVYIDYLEGNAIVGLPRACAASAQGVEHTLRVVFDEQVDAGLRQKGLQPPEDVCLDVVTITNSAHGATTAVGPLYFGRAVRPEAPVASHETVPRLHHLYCAAVFVTAPEPSHWDLDTTFKFRTNKAGPHWPVGTSLDLVDEPQSVFRPAATNFQIIGVPPAALQSEEGTIKLGLAAATDLFSRCHYVSFKNQDALPTVTDLQRQVYLPNYGHMVQMTESYTLQNMAPALWEDYRPGDVGMLMQRYVGTRRYRTRDLTGLLAMFEIPAHLPRGVRNFEFYDAIGNISTSFVEPQSDGGYRVVLEPRYPVMGGWETSFTLRYEVPLPPRRLADGVDEVTVSLAPSVWPLWTESETLNVLLPPRSTVLAVESQAALLAQDLTTERRWLDLFTSRPMVRLTYGPMRLVQGAGSQSVVIRYKQQRLRSQLLQMLSVPAILTALVAAVVAPLLVPHASSVLLKRQVQLCDPSRALLLLGDVFRHRSVSTSEVRELVKGCPGESELEKGLKDIAEGRNVLNAERSVIEGLVLSAEKIADLKK